ncbi:MAG: hypothetical protein NUV60_01945 [Patescibacteria group bacterium]|nr:hypothetical protein [Patescibacteria group bacterium]
MRFRILIALVFISSVALPFAAHAAIPFFGPIIPGSDIPGDVRGVCAASWGMVIVVINNIISFLITLAIVFIAPLTIAYAGFLFVVNPVNASGKEKAKSMLWSTVLGIIIALSSWMIVDAIMAVLYHPTGSVSSTWSTLVTGNSSDLCIPLEGSLRQAATPPAGVVVTPPTGQMINGFATGCSTSNDQNVTLLTSNGVSGRSTNNCCVRNQSTCTSLDGMLPSTVQQIINIQRACGGVVVTGGTEVGHSGEGGTASHSGGAKVDFAANIISCVLQNGGTRVSSPTFGSEQARGRCGNIYTWEGNHTDVYVIQNCTL